MSELEFGFQDVLDELDALDKIIGPYCGPRSRTVLPQLITELKSIRDNLAKRAWPWGIRESNPFYTAVSCGEYQPDDQGADNVFAEITSTWTIQRIPPRKKSGKAARFRLTGNASTRVRIYREMPTGRAPAELAMWRAEIGDAFSPGCHFHVQILGEGDEPPFPRSLDIPRLPTLIVTPAAVVEYVVGELFQESWLKHLSSQSANLNRWWPIQRRYLSAVLAWQLKVIEDASGSPWGTLKKAKPDSQLFVASF
ncbi:MAG: hypothetical protein DMF56_04295 [Acidobacteria bacterium]|nr:MAG: hypothetical protein DMF56_04295 [Acidobacteriota bacterium]